MPSLLNCFVVAIPIFGVLVALYTAYLHETVALLGHFRSVATLNNEDCSKVPGLVGCEDMYLDRASGLLYLACLSPAIRQHWLPAVMHLNTSALPALQPGYFATYDTRTGHVTRLTVEDEPVAGLSLHGFDLYVEPEAEEGKKKQGDEPEETKRRATLFAINHRVPHNRYLSPGTTGADSVIEVFETEIGSPMLKHVKTIEDRHVYTPNNVVAVGHDKFYVSNDHYQKTGLSRKFNTDVLFGSPTSSIAFCDLTKVLGSYCTAAVTETLYPNGIARGPGQSLYAASSILGVISHFQMKVEDDLTLLKTIPIKRILDNIYVDPAGAIYVAAIPQLADFAKVTATLQGQSPVEVWRVSNETGSGSFYSGEARVEMIFADDGKQATTVTSAIPFEGKLYMHGISQEYLLACKIAALDDVEVVPGTAEALSGSSWL